MTNHGNPTNDSIQFVSEHGNKEWVNITLNHLSAFVLVNQHAAW